MLQGIDFVRDCLSAVQGNNLSDSPVTLDHGTATLVISAMAAPPDRIAAYCGQVEAAIMHCITIGTDTGLNHAITGSAETVQGLTNLVTDLIRQGVDPATYRLPVAQFSPGATDVVAVGPEDVRALTILGYLGCGAGLNYSIDMGVQRQDHESSHRGVYLEDGSDSVLGVFVHRSNRSTPDEVRIQMGAFCFPLGPTLSIGSIVASNLAPKDPSPSDLEYRALVPLLSGQIQP